MLVFNACTWERNDEINLRGSFIGFEAKKGSSELKIKKKNSKKLPSQVLVHKNKRQVD